MRIARTLISVALFVMSVAGAASAADTEQRWHQIKTAFLYQFSGYVDWPAGSDETGPFTVGVLGDNPFGPALEALTSQTVDGRRVVVREISSISDAGSCHILYISRSEQERLGDIVSTLSSQSVLTVSELDGFLEAGGMIRLMVHKNKVRFSVNLNAARGANLNVRAPLLQVARRVIQ